MKDRIFWFINISGFILAAAFVAAMSSRSPGQHYHPDANVPVHERFMAEHQ